MAGLRVPVRMVLVVMVNFEGLFRESGGAVGITELANGQEGRVEAIKDVGFGGSR